MIALLLAAALAACPLTNVRNETDTWEIDDMIALNTAKTGCRRIYGPGQCLKDFTKYGMKKYRAVCRLYTEE